MIKKRLRLLKQILRTSTLASLEVYKRLVRVDTSGGCKCMHQEVLHTYEATKEDLFN